MFEEIDTGSGLQIWINALKSGKYRQGRKMLGDPETGMCCLGLACHLAVENGIIKEYDPRLSDLHNYSVVQKWIGLNSEGGKYKRRIFSQITNSRQ